MMPRATDDELRAVIDRAAIIDQHSRLAAALDALDREGLATLFTPDAVVAGWRDAPWQGAELAVQRLIEINADHKGAHRMVTNHLIDLDGDRARAVAHYRSAHLEEIPAPGEYGATHTHEGWYRTEWVRESGAWRMARLEHTSLADSLLKYSK